jgi:hypothetical protein
MSIMNHSSIDKQQKFMHKIRGCQVYKIYLDCLDTHKKITQGKGEEKEISPLS